ncbi:hypothetical protein CSC80_18695 [Maribacter sp. 6B07]|uniref:hypothetical protein n=1 Tax=Maribacter sp. 6B07 TaxID=2045442 RepID=UPI000C07A525|nr:hypothetical protein [Maribacter sp. 6B07]PHN91974.1 hypothetical protein CSC80_18695 [Maribacter sp. 6B07]
MDDFFNREVGQIILSTYKRSEKIRKSDGYSCFKTIHTIRNSFFIYKHNYIEWKKALHEYYSNEDNSISDSVKRHYRQRVLIAKIHNLLSSSTTFNEIHNEGQIEDSFHCFIKELRNFTMHRQYFPLSSYDKNTVLENIKYESFQTDEFRNYLRNYIAKYPNRKGLKRALDFLDSIFGSINLEDLLEKYDKKMHGLYNKKIREVISKNKDLFWQLMNDTEQVHLSLKKVNKLPKYPLSSPELRYLKLILNCHDGKSP